MPRNTLWCRQGIEACQRLIAEARACGCGLKVEQPYLQISPEIFELISTPDNNSLANQFLQKYENHPQVVILYDHEHPKCRHDVFQTHLGGLGVKPKPPHCPRWASGGKDSRMGGERDGGRGKGGEGDMGERRPLNLNLNLNLNLIKGLPSFIIPALMRDYYNFPIVSPANRGIRPKIGIISLGGYYLSSDLLHYWQRNMQYWNPSWGWPTIYPGGPYDHVVGDNVLPQFEQDVPSLENTIDLELVGGFCPSADLHFYSAMNTYQGYLDAFTLAITDQMDLVTTSWGRSEESFYGVPFIVQLFNDVFKTGTTGRNPYGQQITDHYTLFMASAGDYGSSDSNYQTYNISPYGVPVPVPHVDFPASSPWVTACGGTSLYLDPDLPVNEETSWIYGGGGQSSQFLRPSYQGPWQSQWPVSPIAKTDPSTGLPYARTIPDVVFNADPNSPWYIYFAGYVDDGGGTSCCSPVMAGLLGELYCASNDNAAPRQGYYGEGFNAVMYRAPVNCVRLINYGYNVTVDRSPLTRDINPYGLIDQENNTFYKIWPNDRRYTFVSGKGVTEGVPLLAYLNTIVCVAHGTRIQMAEGVEGTSEVYSTSSKPIQEIVRGDQVVGYQGQIFRVAAVNRQYVPVKSKTDLIELTPECLGPSQPIRKLLITPNHPIYFQGARRPAKIFRNLPGVVEHRQVSPEDLLQPETESKPACDRETRDPSDPPTRRVYYLYDLQFEQDGSYLAEGVLVQSRSPWSDLTPLEPELYFDPSRYRKETHWDGLEHPLPLDERDLLP